VSVDIDKQAAGGETITVPRWFGPAGRPLMGWLTERAGTRGTSGVLVLPPVGYPYWSSHRTLRTIAERLAAAGHTVLRIDYDGTGDSAGESSDADRVPAWRESARLGAAELRALGCERLTVLGARLGGTIAMLDGAALGADAVVAWAPVTAGRRYAREIKLLSTPAPDGQELDGVVSAGVVFGAETLAAIGRLSVTDIDAPPAARVVLVGADEAAAEHLHGLGGQVEALEAPDGERALEMPAEYATVPDDVVNAVTGALGEAAGAPGTHAAAPAAAMTWRGTDIEEEAVALGPHELAGILARPAEGLDPERPVLVFLNSGSEPHIGSGRVWVEYSRTLAAEGYACLRPDFSGWGESPDLGHAPGRPYDSHCVQETVEIVESLHRRGHPNVVLAGLCAGAWIALRAVLREPVAGVIALNPQLYWEPGHPVEATMAETRDRRAPERAREERGCRLGLWSALDVAGHRSWAGRWLDELDSAGVPILMLFAAGDDGIEYLRNRLRRRLGRVQRSGAIRVAEVPGIDHSMHRAWLRDRMVDAIRGELQRIDQARGRRPVEEPALS
jgi:pimeloyl-ACP methyl ester carboxylesterase